MEETQIGNGCAAWNTQEGRNLIKSSEHPKDQRENSTDQAQPIANCGESLFHFNLLD